MEATYNITNNRFFFDPSRRLDPEEYAKSKSLKFQWCPGRKIFSGIWSPEKEDFLLSFVDEIQEDDTPDDVEARAERFQQYAEKNEAEAESATNRAQTANTERRQRLAANRAQTAQEKAEHWQQRTASAIAHAQRKDNPGVITRRIEGIEKDFRYYSKEKQTAEMFIGKWNLMDPITQEMAEHIANYCRVNVPSKNPSGYTSLWSAIHDKEITPEECKRIALEAHEKSIKYYNRWIEHLQKRLDYENAYLSAVGGDMRQAEIKAGDFVMCRWGKAQVLKVNKKTIDVKTDRGFSTRLDRSKISEVLTA